MSGGKFLSNARWHRRGGHTVSTTIYYQKLQHKTDDIFGQIRFCGKSTLVRRDEQRHVRRTHTTDSKLFNIYIGKLKLIKLIRVLVSCLVFRSFVAAPDC